MSLPRVCSAAVSALFLILLFPVVAFGEIPDVTWGELEVVDSPVPGVSSPSGISVLHAPTLEYGDDLWHVVYVKDDDIYHRARADSGWLPVDRLSEDPAVSAHPHLAWGDDLLHVVWEDHRTGRPEVWTRRWNGFEWSEEECLTCDTTPSKGPVIDGSFGHAFLAWEEGPDPQIHGRSFQNWMWGTVEEVSASPAYGIQPTVAAHAHPSDDTFRVAWADGRHGAAEIYLRVLDLSSGWGSPLRVTNLNGSCQRPSIHEELCCTDAILPLPLIAFENDGSGTVEVYGACIDGVTPTIAPLSPDDGVPSERPSVHGFGLWEIRCSPFGLHPSKFFVTWTDRPPGGFREHSLSLYEPCVTTQGSQFLTGLALSNSVVGATEGNPLAGLMALWVEEGDDGPALVALHGSLPGCLLLEDQPPASLLLAPEGWPANIFRMTDLCSGNPVSGVPVGIIFSSVLDQDLTWDPMQVHPNIPTQFSDEQGQAVIPIRGGGCSQAGPATGKCEGLNLYSWNGAKSPDVDGDCAVRDDDLAYVSSKVGTGDFCADLDGSGLVDAADVALVEATLGDHCSHITGIESRPSADEAYWLQLSPNPFTGSLRIELGTHARSRFGESAVAGEPELRLEICTPSGRRLWSRASFPEREAFSMPGAVSWDGMDDAGRQVPSGIYFLRLLRNGEVLARRPVVRLH